MKAPGPVVYPDGSPTMGRLLNRDQTRALGEFVFYDDEPASREELIRRIEPACAVILGWARIDGEVLARCPHLRIISFTGVGVEAYVDLQAATARGVAVANTPGYGDDTVAEHTMALILAAARRLPVLHAGMTGGGWLPRPGIDLRGRQLGIVGLGPIGSRVARLGRAFGMQVVAWTRRPSPLRAQEHGVRFMELAQLFETSDVVSLHLALTPQTRGIVGRDLLRRMKPGAIFVNTARGGLVDAETLLEILQEGRVWAALDVFDEEPLQPGHPLRRLENVVLTPHVGFYTEDATRRMLEIAVENVRAFFAGTPQNVVNPQVLRRP